MFIAIKKQKNNFELYNLGDRKSISIKNLVKKIIKTSGKKLRITYNLSKPTLKTSISIDSSKAIKDLGWKQKYNIDKGISKTIKWYKNYYK